MRERRFADIDWIALAYETKGWREVYPMPYAPVPEDVAYTEDQHYIVVIDCLKYCPKWRHF